MDVDAYVAAHRGEWDRLDQLVRRAGRGRGSLDGAEVDELVTLYQRVGDPPVRGALGLAGPGAGRAAVRRWSRRARSAVTGAQRPAWQDVARFFVVSFPAALYRSMRWWVAVGCRRSCWSAWWSGPGWPATREVQATIAAPEEIRQLVEHDFEDYYSSAPAGSFAAQVWTNNAWVAALVPGRWVSSCCPWSDRAGRTRSTSASSAG